MASEKRVEAERLYTRKNMTCPAIAAELQLDKGTVYKWKAEAAEKGGTEDWDVRRRLCNFSPAEFKGIFFDALAITALQIKENPGMLLDAKTADAISKNLCSMERIDTRKHYLGAITDLLKEVYTWLAANQPELKSKMDPHWDALYEALVSYAMKKELF
jgi:hypothetical protein